MSPEDTSKTATFERQLAGQAALRREQAALSIERKVAILVRLQAINAQLARQKGRPAPEPWNIRKVT
jgi:hypothetical protein